MDGRVLVRPVCGPSLWRYAGFSRFSGLSVGFGVCQRPREPTFNDAQPNPCGQLWRAALLLQVGHLLAEPESSLPEFEESDYCTLTRW